MLDIKWAMEQFGFKDERSAIRFLEDLDKFNYGCFHCGSSDDLVYTEMKAVFCKECRENLCFNDEGLIDNDKLSEAFELAWALESEDDDENEDYDWLDDDEPVSGCQGDRPLVSYEQTSKLYPLPPQTRQTQVAHNCTRRLFPVRCR